MDIGQEYYTKVLQCLQSIEGTLGRIANAIEMISLSGATSISPMEEARLHPSSGMLPGLDDVHYKPSREMKPHFDFHDIGPLSSADSREGDNLTPYKPVDFMHFSTLFSTAELMGARSMCGDDECQK